MKNPINYRRLRHLRKVKKMDQSDVASYLGICRVSYNLIEKGKRVPRVSNIVKLAKLFGVEIDYLFVKD